MGAVLGLLGALLNHSSVWYGINLSFSDGLAVVILVVLMASRRLWLDRGAAGFFLAVAILGIAAAWIVGPVVSGSPSRLGTVLLALVKLVTSLGYYAIGFSLGRRQLSQSWLRGFALAATVLAAAGVVVGLSGSGTLRSPLYFYGVRLQGLTSDPNYFAVIQVCAIVVILRLRLSLAARVASIAMLVASVVMSGSKTGVVVLLAYLVVAAVRLLGKRPTANSRRLAGGLSVVALAGVLVAMGVHAWGPGSAWTAVPGVDRISVLFDDFGEAVVDSGSSRSAVWDTGWRLLLSSPILGLGLGTYRDVSQAVGGPDTVAHNTYLQLAVEWGVPLTSLFVGRALALVWWANRRSSGKALGALPLADVVTVLLVGSMSLSLNNCRLLWLALGALAGAESTAAVRLPDSGVPRLRGVAGVAA